MEIELIQKCFGLFLCSTEFIDIKKNEVRSIHFSRPNLMKIKVVLKESIGLYMGRGDFSHCLFPIYQKKISTNRSMQKYVTVALYKYI